VGLINENVVLLLLAASLSHSAVVLLRYRIHLDLLLLVHPRNLQLMLDTGVSAALVLL
jgi:hypothetical protein